MKGKYLSQKVNFKNFEFCKKKQEPDKNTVKEKKNQILLLSQTKK